MFGTRGDSVRDSERLAESLLVLAPARPEHRTAGDGDGPARKGLPDTLWPRAARRESAGPGSVGAGAAEALAAVHGAVGRAHLLLEAVLGFGNDAAPTAADDGALGRGDDGVQGRGDDRAPGRGHDAAPDAGHGGAPNPGATAGARGGVPSGADRDGFVLDPGPGGAGGADDGAAMAGGAGDAGGLLPPGVRALLGVVGPVTVADLDATITVIGDVFRAVHSLEAIAGVLIERARVQATRVEGVLNESDPNVAAGSLARRRELARRSVISDIAQETRQGEYLVTCRMNDAEALVSKAPRTLAGAVAGHVAWRNAIRVADAATDLEGEATARFDELVAEAAQRQNPSQFARTVRRVRERVHPVPALERHRAAAAERCVQAAPAADGMAYLTLFAPAPAVHAIADRLTQVATTARTARDARTLDQLRADAMCALLLDDGTLDLDLGADLAATTSAESRGDAEVADTHGANAHTAGTHGADTHTADIQPGVPWEGGGDASAEVFGTRFSLARFARSVRPRVYVTVPVLTLLGRSDEPALLDGTVPIDPETARELAGTATSFHRLLTDPETGTVLSVGSTAYRPPADLKHYLTARDATCRFPGCTRRAAEADLDHTLAAVNGGRTSAPNLAALCRRHHVLKHQVRYAVTQSRDGDGTMTWTSPTGRTTTTRPDPVPATRHTADGRLKPTTDDRFKLTTDGRHELTRDDRHKPTTRGHHEPTTDDRHKPTTDGRHELTRDGRLKPTTAGHGGPGAPTRDGEPQTHDDDLDAPPF